MIEIRNQKSENIVMIGDEEKCLSILEKAQKWDELQTVFKGGDA